MEVKDTANIGLSSEMHMKLSEMKDAKLFSEMKDGYRLAVSLAMKKMLNVNDRIISDRKNMYDVGGVDENSIFKNAINTIYPDEAGKEYKYLEKLADAGVEFLYENYDKTGSLNLIEILSDDT